MSLALTGRFLTTGPPGKSMIDFSDDRNKVIVCVQNVMFCFDQLVIDCENFLSQSLYLSFKKLLDGEGNGNPLQYSCLEKSMDRGARRAAVHGFT